VAVLTWAPLNTTMSYGFNSTPPVPGGGIRKHEEQQIISTNADKLVKQPNRSKHSKTSNTHHHYKKTAAHCLKWRLHIGLCSANIRAVHRIRSHNCATRHQSGCLNKWSHSWHQR
jgi:hypothetical protein